MYLVPSALRERMAVGTPVLVPLGGREQLGYVLSTEDLPQEPETLRLRPIRAIQRPDPAFDLHTVELLRWIAREYRCSLADALPLAVPERHAAELQSVVALGEWDGSVPPRVGLLTRHALEALHRALVQAGRQPSPRSAGGRCRGAHAPERPAPRQGRRVDP